MRHPLLTRRRLRSLAVSLLLVAGGVLPATAQGPSNAVIEYYHLDAIGSVRAVTDANGAVVRRHDYFPFGEEAAPPPGANSLRFAGKARDGETGLDYFQARYYASRAGRFTTVDPVVPIDDALLDPQRWNRYSYVMNRPLVLTDPDGRCPQCVYFLQRLASTPTAQRAQQVVATQGARAWVALTRLFNTPAGQEAIETTSELLTGAALGPTTGAARQGIGAVIGHYDAGYAKVGRDFGVAVFDIPKEIWDRLTPEQRTRANERFLQGVVERRLVVKVVANGRVRIPSILAWEIDYLVGKGYRWNEAGDTLLPPKQ